MEFDENLNPIEPSNNSDWGQMPIQEPDLNNTPPIQEPIEPKPATPPPPPAPEVAPTPPPEPPKIDSKPLVTDDDFIEPDKKLEVPPKNSWLWVLIVISTLMTAIAITAIATKNQPVVSAGDSVVDQGLRVTEIGEAYATPDVAKINFGVTTEAKDVALSQKNNGEKVAQIKNDLARFNIEAKDIKTTSYSINPNYDYSLRNKPKLLGYNTRHYLEITVRKLEDADAIVQALGNSGVTEINKVAFTVDDITEIQDEAREQAIAKAKAKAESLANLSGAKLGKIISIQEGNYQDSSSPIYYKYLDGLGGGETITEIGLEEGSTIITSTVTITYTLN